jgi:hypothetical protein
MFYVQLVKDERNKASKARPSGRNLVKTLVLLILIVLFSRRTVIIVSEGWVEPTHIKINNEIDHTP